MTEQSNRATAGYATWCREEDLESYLADGWHEAGARREATTDEQTGAYCYVVKDDPE